MATRRYDENAPYELDRSSLRARFGGRATTNTQSPRNALSLMGRMAPAGASGFTPDSSWDLMFPKAAPVAGVPNVVPADAAPIESAWRDTVLGGPPASSPLASAPSAPTDYIKAAFDSSTSYWNKLGVKIPSPPAGLVQYGDSVENKYGTGSVERAGSPTMGLRRLLKPKEKFSSYA